MTTDPPTPDASGVVAAMLRRLLRPHVRLLVARQIPSPPLHDLRDVPGPTRVARRRRPRLWTADRARG